MLFQKTKHQISLLFKRNSTRNFEFQIQSSFLKKYWRFDETVHMLSEPSVKYDSLAYR